MKANREELQKILTEMKPALARLALQEGGQGKLVNFWFDGLSITAYDGGLGICFPYKSDLSCGVPGKVLLDLLGTSTLDQVSIEQQGDNVVVGLGRSRFKLAGTPGDERVWPFLAQPPKKKQPIVLTERVFAALKRIDFLRASKPTQAVHYGVLMDVQEAALEVYATDTFTVARVSVPERCGMEARFLVPWVFLDRVTSLLKPGAQLYVLDDALMATEEGILICSNLMELPDRPDLPVLVQTRADGLAAVTLPKGLKLLVKRAGVVAGQDDPIIELAAQDSELRVKGKFAAGSVDEKLVLDKPFKKAVTAKVNAGRVLRGLEASDRLALSPEGICLYGGEEFCYIVAGK